MERSAPLKLEALRRQLAVPAEIRPRPGALSTGFSRLDEALGGGLPAGRLSEIAGARSSGKTALALGLLARQTGAGALGAFIDGRGQLYPPAAALLGVDLSCLLVARPPARGDDIARAAEILSRSRAFSLIVLEPPARDRIPAPRLRRLRSAAHASGTALIILTDSLGAIDRVAVRLEVLPKRDAAAAHVSRRLEVRVCKGSASGGPARVGLELRGHRIDPRPPEPAAPPIDRPLPGQEVS